MPSSEILKLYRELGGEVITIGSDSHNINHFGYKINDMRDFLKTIGYKYFCTFDKMCPKYHCL